jgi:hypothetical protein
MGSSPQLQMLETLKWLKKILSGLSPT